MCPHEHSKRAHRHEGKAPCKPNSMSSRKKAGLQFVINVFGKFNVCGNTIGNEDVVLLAPIKATIEHHSHSGHDSDKEECTKNHTNNNSGSCRATRRGQSGGDNFTLWSCTISFTTIARKINVRKLADSSVQACRWTTHSHIKAYISNAQMCSCVDVDY